MLRFPTARRPGRTGVRTRLVGLVLLPSVIFAAGAGREVADLQGRSAAVDRLAAEVDGAAVALEAFVLASREVRLSELVVQARRFGLSPDDAGALLGIDLTRELSGVRSRSNGNAVLTRLTDDVGGPDRLARTRAALDDGGPAAGRGVLRSLSDAAKQLWLDELADVLDRSDRIPLEPHLRRAIEGFEASADLFRKSHEQLLAASLLVVPTVSTDPFGAPDPAVAAGRYTSALERAEATVDRHARDALRVVSGDDSFGEAVARLSEVGPGAVDVPAVAAVFRAGLERDAAVEELTAATSGDVRRHAVAVGAQARSDYHRTLLVAGAVVLGGIGLALAVAGSIAGPLRRLARRAAEVSDGELDGEPLGPSGPRETTVLARTLDEAVGNLRAVERHMAALASGDLDVTADAPPGKLGHLVVRSVEGLATSIADRERLQQRLAHEASHDALTGLANRRTAMAELDAMLTGGAPLGLLFLDLDGFKAINDELGHAVGDALLKIAAQRLRSIAPSGALVARIGGDEFVIALPVEHDSDAVALAESITRLLDTDATVAGIRQRIAVSVGVAVACPGDDADRLLRLADAALYRAKRAQRGRVVLLDEALRDELEAEHALESDLRAAIAAGSLEVHYQPVFEIDGGIHGIEALVRWPLDDGSLLPPDSFIPVAERSGLIVDLDTWVLDTALHQLGEWRRGAFPDLRLSVNVSARTLQSSHFVDVVRAALQRQQVEGAALVVEVTETALLHDLESAAVTINQLLDLGVATSVDDFGTGYTSVLHLRRLPVREIKIDRSFVHAMVSSERDRMLADLIARIGSVLALDVVAEGVESDAQLAGVRALGCRYVQGFRFGRPVPASTFEADHTPMVTARPPITPA